MASSYARSNSLPYYLNYEGDEVEDMPNNGPTSFSDVFIAKQNPIALSIICGYLNYQDIINLQQTNTNLARIVHKQYWENPSMTSCIKRQKLKNRWRSDDFNLKRVSFPRWNPAGRNLKFTSQSVFIGDCDYFVSVVETSMWPSDMVAPVPTSHYPLMFVRNIQTGEIVARVNWPAVTEEKYCVLKYDTTNDEVIRTKNKRHKIYVLIGFKTHIEVKQFCFLEMQLKTIWRIQGDPELREHPVEIYVRRGHIIFIKEDSEKREVAYTYHIARKTRTNKMQFPFYKGRLNRTDFLLRTVFAPKSGFLTHFCYPDTKMTIYSPVDSLGNLRARTVEVKYPRILHNPLNWRFFCLLDAKEDLIPLEHKFKSEDPVYINMNTGSTWRQKSLRPGWMPPITVFQPTMNVLLNVFFNSLRCVVSDAEKQTFVKDLYLDHDDLNLPRCRMAEDYVHLLVYPDGALLIDKEIGIAVAKYKLK